jgi:hypothetical protein
MPHRVTKLICSALLLALLLVLLPGCVERALVVRSEPPGAKVFVDGKEVGTTPVRVPFDYYGTREVMVRMEETADLRGERALAPETRLVKISAPWYQWFPVDLVTEYFWPGTIHDDHELDFALIPHDADTLRAQFEDRAREHGLRMPFDPRPPEPDDDDGETEGNGESTDDATGDDSSSDGERRE